jgi:MinD superfamily P-loop ATPase
LDKFTEADQNMKEIVIISGKGGTGKTSITASFAELASGRAVMVDCDVDAADLHLILKPEIQSSIKFRSGHKAFVNEEQCVECGKCVEVCRFNAVKSSVSGNMTAAYSIDPVACEGCGVCVRFCPVGAIGFSEEVCGHWFISDTRFGKMVHAKLNVAAENSGKLVTLVRKEAKKIAQEQGAEFVLIDGSPGIGCPVIASLTAASIALIVTEPSVSGDHDLQRIAHLTKQLGVPTFVCVNKWDINPDITVKIRKFARESGIGFAGQVRYDKVITAAQRVEKTIIEYCENGISDDIRKIWKVITIGNNQ